MSTSLEAKGTLVAPRMSLAGRPSTNDDKCTILAPTISDNGREGCDEVSRPEPIHCNSGNGCPIGAHVLRAASPKQVESDGLSTRHAIYTSRWSSAKKSVKHSATFRSRSGEQSSVKILDGGVVIASTSDSGPGVRSASAFESNAAMRPATIEGKVHNVPGRFSVFVRSVELVRLARSAVIIKYRAVGIARRHLSRVLNEGGPGTSTRCAPRYGCVFLGSRSSQSPVPPRASIRSEIELS